MTAHLAAAPSPTSWGQRFLRFPLTRIVLATFATALSVGLSMSLASTLAGEASHAIWPKLVGAGGAYGLEASLFTLLVLTVTGAGFLWKARVRGHLLARGETLVPIEFSRLG